jgi:hypothetical protein
MQGRGYDHEMLLRFAGPGILFVVALAFEVIGLESTGLGIALFSVGGIWLLIVLARSPRFPLVWRGFRRGQAKPERPVPGPPPTNPTKSHAVEQALRPLLDSMRQQAPAKPKQHRIASEARTRARHKIFVDYVELTIDMGNALNPVRSASCQVLTPSGTWVTPVRSVTLPALARLASIAGALQSHLGTVIYPTDFDNAPPLEPGVYHVDWYLDRGKSMTAIFGPEKIHDAFRVTERLDSDP